MRHGALLGAQLLLLLLVSAALAGDTACPGDYTVVIGSHLHVPTGAP